VRENTARMKNPDQAEKYCQKHYFNAAVGYFELEMFDEAEAELNKIQPCVAAQSVPVLSLRLAISCSRGDWSRMKALARQLYLLEPSNPRWPFSDGFATGKIDSLTREQD
jgi:hypothetical protein